MEPVRIGLIGLGIMGSGHLKTLMGLPELYKVCAVCDNNPEKLKNPNAEGIPQFTDYRELIDSGLCEAVGIATPHPCHAEIAIYALEHGLDTMCEKPLSETVSKADKMLDVWKRSGKILCTNFSMRTTPVNQVIREWVREGKLGNILRVDFVCTHWIRSKGYYNSSSWRGNWIGEGGGILMNQAPHNLDSIYYWFGDVESVTARLATRFHSIEVEDEADAVIRMKAGFPVRFYCTTGEAPGIDRVEIVGDKGTLIRGLDGVLRFQRLSRPVSELLASDEISVKHEVTEEIVPVPDKIRGAVVVWQNLAHVIREGGELIAPGDEAITALEMANAMTLSHFSGKEEKLPVSRERYDSLLAELRSGERKL